MGPAALTLSVRAAMGWSTTTGTTPTMLGARAAWSHCREETQK